MQTFKEAMNAMKAGKKVQTKDGIIYKRINSINVRKYGGPKGKEEVNAIYLELQSMEANSVTISRLDQVKVVN